MRLFFQFTVIMTGDIIVIWYSLIKICDEILKKGASVWPRPFIPGQLLTAATQTHPWRMLFTVDKNNFCFYDLPELKLIIIDNDKICTTVKITAYVYRRRCRIITPWQVVQFQSKLSIWPDRAIRDFTRFQPCCPERRSYAQYPYIRTAVWRLCVL